MSGVGDRSRDRTSKYPVFPIRWLAEIFMRGVVSGWGREERVGKSMEEAQRVVQPALAAVMVSPGHEAGCCPPIPTSDPALRTLLLISFA